MQNTANQDEAWVRSIAAFFAIALHALLIVELGRALRGVHDLQHDNDVAMMLVIVPTAIQREPDLRKEEAKHTPAGGSTTRTSETVRQVPPIEEPTRTPKTPSDWRAHAARSAQRVVEASGTAGHRSFGPRETLDTSIGSPPSVFPEPKHSPGEVGEDAYGDPVLWLSDNCFQELDKPVPTARDIFTIVPLVKCIAKSVSVQRTANYSNTSKNHKSRLRRRSVRR